MIKGYLKAIEDKLLQPVNETFYSIPIDDANYCYFDRLSSEASMTQCQPIKGRSSDGGLATSPMIKLVKT